MIEFIILLKHLHFVLLSKGVWPAVNLINLISNVNTLLLSDFLIVQASLPYVNTNLAKVL